MNAAARAAGRDPQEILLCAASKMNDADRVEAAVAGGVDCCGENRVQELTQKQPLRARIRESLSISSATCRPNKVKQVVGSCRPHPVSGPAGAAGVHRQRQREKGPRAEHPAGGQHRRRRRANPASLRRQAVEIAATNGGISPLSACRGLDGNSARQCKIPGDNRRYFAEMRNLFVDIGARKNTIMSLWIVCPWA